jgi:glycosyltransferase involved in cell wall biosynthesis
MNLAPVSSASRHFLAETVCDPQEFSDELVTVVVPAYNAAATIRRTLKSIQKQTHRNLEILVVDDGSTDATRAIVEKLSQADPRIRLVPLSNSGVAAARNMGIVQAKGRFIAPIDADDLWRSDKVALQLRAFRDGGEQIGLVYTWYKIIDEDDRVIVAKPTPPVEGDLLQAIAIRNIVGNGSSVMFRREVALAVGGYDSTLRRRDAQGCEDWKLYFQIAERYEFALIPAFLTGYRQLRGNMSSNVMRMLRSRDLCMDEFTLRHPELRRRFHQSRNILMRFMLHRSLRDGRPMAALRLVRAMLAHDVAFALTTLSGLPLKAVWLGLRKLAAPVRRSESVYWRDEAPEPAAAAPPGIGHEPPDVARAVEMTPVRRRDAAGF